MRQRVTFYVTEQQLEYLQREAARRRRSLSSYVADCVLEYHQQSPVRGETPTAPSPPFDVLLRESEQRLLLEIVKRNSSQGGSLNKQLTALTAMLDRFVLSALVHAPEIAPDRRAEAVSSGERRYANWRQAVTELLDGIEAPRPHTWNDGNSHRAQEEQG
jgi:hypothetical protein